MINHKSLIFILLIISACKPPGNLAIEGSINDSITEASAIEISRTYDAFWTIEDAGNDSELIALNRRGKILHSLPITNAKNIDWEDLTSDKKGNIYIGDFGNNNKKRKQFTIYKVKNEDLNETTAKAERIDFTLSKKQHSKDFEAFILYEGFFYIFSKEHKNFIVVKVPNKIGNHEAVLIKKHEFNGKHNKITSAAMSKDGKTLVLLNHEKLWKMTNFKSDDFFSGTVKKLPFKHNSQKEGVCFLTDSTVVITDERNGSEGGNIYTFALDLASDF